MRKILKIKERGLDGHRFEREPGNKPFLKKKSKRSQVCQAIP